MPAQAEAAKAAAATASSGGAAPPFKARAAPASTAAGIKPKLPLGDVMNVRAGERSGVKNKKAPGAVAKAAAEQVRPTTYCDERELRV